MIYNNLNRVKGILSARLGAQVPKFQNSGKIYKKLPDGKELFSDDDGITWKYVENPNIFYESTQNSSFLELPYYDDVTRNLNISRNNLNIALLQENHSLNESLDTFDENRLRTAIANTAENVSNQMNLLLMQEKEKDNKVTQATKDAAQITGSAIQGLGTVFGTQQSTTDSNTTKIIDSGIKTMGSLLSNMQGTAGGIGQILQIGSAAGQIIEGITGGTDQMTATDKFFNSGIGTVLGGWVNQLWGKNSEAFGIDQSMAETVGSSYGGSMDQLNEAARTADKKYGLFSSKARRKANESIAAMKATQNQMSNIANTATDQRLAVQSMGEQAGLAYSMMTDGGYNQKYTYAAKHGGLLEWNPVIELEWKPQVELNQELPTFKTGGSVEFIEELEWIPEFKDGGKTEDKYPKEYLEFKESLPDNQRNTSEDDYRTYLYWQLWGQPKNFQYTLEHPDENGNYMYTWDNSDNSYHASTIAWKDDIGYFMKPKHHSTLKYELDWYNKGLITEEGGNQREMTPEENKEWEEFKSNYELVDDGDFYKYIPKNKKGGYLGDSDIPETEETNQKNVIPVGALHKNKHHMEHAEGLTKKGIPVVDEDGEQQAEIEHSEIIFTLEVTKKLEEYYEIFYSEESTNKEKEQAALDAGKLLVYQILENTEDRTGLIESCKKGGSLKLKTSTDDLIEEVLEWMPTIVVIEEEEIKEEKSKEDKKKSEKEQMKEAIKEVLIELLTK